MSQVVTSRPLARPGGASALPSRLRTPRLRVITPTAGDGSRLFFTLCVALVLGGFLAILLLNTAMARGSFVLDELGQRSDRLADTQQELEVTIDRYAAPGHLARRALGLGMVPAESAAFLRLSDGKVLGVATPATGKGSFSVVIDGSTPVVGSPPPGVRKAPAKPAAATTTVTTKGGRTTISVTTRVGSITTTTTTVRVGGALVSTTVTKVDATTGTKTTTTTTH